MDTEKIIQIARRLKKQCNDSIELCKMLDIKIQFTSLKPNIYPAYTLISSQNPTIVLNQHFTDKSQKVLCAHEMAHAMFHSNKLFNEFGDEHNETEEYEANLFAVAFLFNENDLNINLFKTTNLDNYLLKGILDTNLELKTETL